MFNSAQKSLAIKFARALSKREYDEAHAMCSQELRSQIKVDRLREEFEDMIPLDWGVIDPIELEESGDYPFIYVVLGGDVYSEAIIIDSFSIENNQVKVGSYQFGRP